MRPSRFVFRLLPLGLAALSSAHAQTAPPFSVQSPASGTRWCLGTQQTLRWTTNLPADRKLKLELLDGMGNVFKLVATNVPNQGTYAWNLDPAQYVFGEGTFKLRIATVDGAAKADSPHTFVLGRPLTLSMPQPQHTWRQGSQYTIRWMNGCVLSVATVKVELLDAAKAPLQTLAPAVPIGQPLSWTVPQAQAPGTYHIRITTADGAHTVTGAFKVEAPVAAPAQSASLAILSPETGTQWCVGEPQTIRWRSSLPATEKLKLELLLSDNSPFRVLSPSAPNTGSYAFNMTAAEFGFGSGTLRLRISSADGKVVSTTGNFQLGKPLFISNPKSQYTWRKGSAYTIAWTAGCAASGALVKIELLDASRTPLRVLVSNHPAGQTYRWTVPADLTAGKHHIRVSLVGTSHSAEESFTLGEPAS